MKGFPGYLIIFLLAGSVLYNSASAQELYMPYNILQAYQKGSRSYSGEPGKNYFQNGSEYRIKVDFDPVTGELNGEETIVYSNNSKDTLTRMVIRLYQDVFKKGNIRDEAVDPSDVTNGVLIKSLSVDGRDYDTSNTQVVRRKGTNLFLWLQSPVYPGEKARLKISWNVRMPLKTQRRFGKYNEISHFVAYWYPQISVYDDIDGWDVLDYTTTQEFYNDYSGFDVDITVPSGYLVWAAGKWQNADKILNEPFLSRFKEAQHADSVIHIVTAGEREKGGIVKGDKPLTWKFKADHITDFSFAVSNSYLWDAVSAVADSITGRRTVVHAVYPENSTDFYDVAAIGKECVTLLSTKVIGIPFPYDKLTAFNGKRGMEFPMMINDGDYGYYMGAVDVTSHEMTHAYFPFMVGTNERKYAWMDEGLATLLPKEIMQLKNPYFNPYEEIIRAFEYYSGEEQEVPLMIPSNQTRGWTYQQQAYWHAATAFYFLSRLLGEKEFKAALREFIRRWEGKHPIPYDFFFTFNNFTGKDLNWYWNAWFFQPGWADLAIKDFKSGNDSVRITIKKKGALPVPVKLKINFTDGSSAEINESLSVWKDTNEYIIKRKFDKTISALYLGDDMIPDKDPSDNYRMIKPN